MHAFNPQPHYLAATSTTLIATTTTLAEMRTLLADTFTPYEREDVVVWDVASDGRARVALVLTADGRSLEMAGPMICWQWQAPQNRPA